MLPTFFLVGVPKAGTTALYHALRQHPDVFMSPHKEPNYFAQPEKTTPVRTLDQYERLFSGVAGQRAVGEASTDYFHHPEAPRRILEHVPTARAVVVLRDPAERSYSHYSMLVRSGAVAQRPYLDVLLDQPWAAGGALTDTYGTGVHQSFYADALERHLRLFGPDRLRIYLYRDFRSAPEDVLDDLFGFLGVDRCFRPQLARRNTSSQPRNSRLHRLLRRPNRVREVAKALVPIRARRAVSAWVHRQNQVPLDSLDPEARRLLISLLLPDIERVEALLGRDLLHWKEPLPSEPPPSGQPLSVAACDVYQALHLPQVGSR